jgi:hypothetical protein
LEGEKRSFWNGRDDKNRNNLFCHRGTAGAEDLSASQVLAKQKMGVEGSSGKIDEISKNSQKSIPVDFFFRINYPSLPLTGQLFQLNAIIDDHSMMNYVGTERSNLNAMTKFCFLLMERVALIMIGTCAG